MLEQPRCRWLGASDSDTGSINPDSQRLGSMRAFHFAIDNHTSCNTRDPMWMGDSRTQHQPLTSAPAHLGSGTLSFPFRILQASLSSLSSRRILQSWWVDGLVLNYLLEPLESSWLGSSTTATFAFPPRSHHQRQPQRFSAISDGHSHLSVSRRSIQRKYFGTELHPSLTDHSPHCISACLKKLPRPLPPPVYPDSIPTFTFHPTSLAPFSPVIDSVTGPSKASHSHRGKSGAGL